MGRKRRARLLLWRSRRRRRDDPTLLKGRATLEYASGNPRRAAKSFALALKSAPDDLDVLGERVAVLRAMGRYDEAREALSVALGRHPDDVRLQLWLGLVELEDHQLEAAEALFARAHGNSRERLELVRLHAASMRLLGKLAEAEELLEGVIGDDETPDSAELIVQLAVVRFARGFPDEAESLSRRALVLKPGNEDAASSVSWLLERQGRREDALQCLREAIEHSPGSRPLLVEAARVAHELHNYSAATTYYKKALEIRRDGEARKGLRQVRWRSGRVPLLAPFLRSIDRDTRRRFDAIRPVLALLDDVLPESDAGRRPLRTRAARLAWRRARSNAVLMAFAQAIFGAMVVAIAVITWLSPLVIGGTDDPGKDPLSDYLIFGGIYLAIMAAVWALWSWTLSSDRSSSLVIRLAWLAGGPAAALVVLLRARGDAPDELVLPLLWAAAALAAMCTLHLAVTLVLVGIERLVERRARRTDPYAAAVTALLSVLYLLRNGVDPVDRAEVRPIVSSLEEAAAGLEDHLRGLQSTGDIRSDAWLAARASGIAAAIRELKGWVLSPGAETFKALATRIESDVASISQGYWRNLPWSDPSAAAATARRLRLVSGARNTVVAALPLAGVLVADSAGILESSTADQLLLATSAWGGVALLVTLDPTVMDKLAAFREARGMMKQGGSKTGSTP